MHVRTFLTVTIALAAVMVVGFDQAPEGPFPESLIPRSAVTLAVFNPGQMERSPVSAKAVDWKSFVRGCGALGLDVNRANRVVVAEVEKFDSGAGVMIAASGSTQWNLQARFGQATPSFERQGLSFRPALAEGWYWVEKASRWIVLCDRVGCEIAAPVLAGSEPALVSNSPAEAVGKLVQALPRDRPFTLLWIPSVKSRDSWEAASVWTGLAVSTYFRNSALFQLVERFGAVEGILAEGWDESGRVRSLMHVAMSSEESARFVAGTLGLLYGVAAGTEQLAKSLGADVPRRPNDPEVEFTRKEDIIVLRALMRPR